MPGTFRFTSLVPVAEYEYWLNDEAHHTVVAAPVSASAAVRDRTDCRVLHRVRRAQPHPDGAVSEVTTFYFEVNPG